MESKSNNTALKNWMRDWSDAVNKSKDSNELNKHTLDVTRDNGDGTETVFKDCYPISFDTVSTVTEFGISARIHSDNIIVRKNKSKPPYRAFTIIAICLILAIYALFKIAQP